MVADHEAFVKQLEEEIIRLKERIKELEKTIKALTEVRAKL